MAFGNHRHIYASVVRTSARTPHLAREDVVSGRVRQDSDDSSTLSFAGSFVDTPIVKECFGACKTGTNSGNAAGLGLSLGVCAAFACNSAHELAHGRKRQDRAVGSLMFLIIGYGHFWAAHATHHAKVILCPLNTHACASWTAAPHAVQVL